MRPGSIRRSLKKNDPSFVRDLQKEAMLPVIRREIPLKVHAHRADDILTALRIAREYDVDVTLDHCTEGHLIIRQLQEATIPC